MQDKFLKLHVATHVVTFLRVSSNSYYKIGINIQNWENKELDL